MKNIKNLKPNSGGPYSQGYYKVQNPDKYVGDLTKAIYRSSWEKKFMILCDLSMQIVKWGSEPIVIKYFNPIDNKMHNYNVDFFIEVLNNDGERVRYIVEIKPSIQIDKEPVLEGRVTEKKLENFMKLKKDYIVNNAKKRAAIEWATIKGMRYIILTEKNWPFK